MAPRSAPENQREVQEAMAKAKALESKGLWRRAATAYTSIMGMTSTSNELWGIARLRSRCLRNARRRWTLITTTETAEEGIYKL